MQVMGEPKTSDHIPMKIKMPNASQEPQASSKVPNHDLKDMDVIYTFKIKMGSHRYIMSISKTSNYIQIKMKMPNLSKEPPASSKAPNDDLKDMDVLCTFKIKIESQNWDHGCIKDQ